MFSRVLLGLFFASAGIAGGRVATADPMALVSICCLLLFMYLTHGAFIYASARALRTSRLDAAVASNAGVGGPATAAALAASKDVDATAGILLGNLGNATATFLALAAVPVLARIL